MDERIWEHLNQGFLGDSRRPNIEHLKGHQGKVCQAIVSNLVTAFQHQLLKRQGREMDQAIVRQFDTPPQIEVLQRHGR